jgi:cell division protein FtsI/penicillin-binding protein 2
MLMQVVLHGFAQPAKVPGYTVAAKTGTATTQGLAADQTEASLAGFIPATNPQFVMLVKIDQPQATIYGGTAAAPLWKAIAQQLMWYYHIPPDDNS